MASTKPHAAIVASPGMGHLTPVLELGKRLATHHNFDVTVFTVATTASPSQSQLHSTNLFNIRTLPPVDVSGSVDPNATIFTKLLVIMQQSKPQLRSAIAAMRPCPTVLIVDFFSTSALTIADELGMAKYVYVPSTAWFVAMTLYVPTLHKEVVEGELVSEEQPLQIPGCKPVRFQDAVDSVKDRAVENYGDYIRIGEEMLRADGVLVNTWEDLERRTIGAFRDHKDLRKAVDVPVYPVGPLIRSAEPSDPRSYVLSWLDRQPSKSVLYLSFGSGGSLSAQQITELAWGLELSKQRFIWVLRPPMEHGAVDYLSAATTDGCDAVKDHLPNGFLTRTNKTGLVVPMWAPQSEILSHRSVGGFLSHCGWNSSLESIVNGVPLIAWPLYAEQNMNATLLVEVAGVAVGSASEGVVMRQEIEKMVRRVMEGEEGSGMRERADELRNSGEKALRIGGSSFESLSQVANPHCQPS